MAQNTFWPLILLFSQVACLVCAGWARMALLSFLQHQLGLGFSACLSSSPLMLYNASQGLYTQGQKRSEGGEWTSVSGQAHFLHFGLLYLSIHLPKQVTEPRPESNDEETDYISWWEVMQNIIVVVFLINLPKNYLFIYFLLAFITIKR